MKSTLLSKKIARLFVTLLIFSSFDQSLQGSLIQAHANGVVKEKPHPSVSKSLSKTKLKPQGKAQQKSLKRFTPLTPPWSFTAADFKEQNEALQKLDQFYRFF